MIFKICILICILILYYMCST